MISENKLKHMLGVARECRELARQRNYSEDLCDAMFIMGFLHDVGYEDEDSLSHGSRGDQMITSFITYIDDCCDAIAAHGFTIDGWSEFDYILNLADMTVSNEGTKVPMEERLADIKKRWGSNSDNYINACEVATKLKEMK